VWCVEDRLTTRTTRTARSAITTRTIKHLDAACAWEIVTKLVKGDCHDAISGVKGLFHSVSVMNIDINVQHSGVVSKELSKRN
jgi:hypothetical protein